MSKKSDEPSIKGLHIRPYLCICASCRAWNFCKFLLDIVSCDMSGGAHDAKAHNDCILYVVDDCICCR